jgi:hypothetical protein
MDLRIVFNIAKNPDGTLKATLDSPDQGAKDIPADSVKVEGDKLLIEIKGIRGSYSGVFKSATQEIEGSWTQNVQVPLKLKRVDKVPELKRPQTPKPPYPYLEEQVSYENKAAGIKLAGTLTLPRSGGPFPAVLLITGSGSQDRDETIFGHKPFMVIADDLTRRGLAVLRVDDRGVGGSTGSPTTATTEDFAGDVLTGVEYLKSRSDIDPHRIGLIGHSEGGVIAPMVAAKSRDVAFIVLLAGTGVTGDRQDLGGAEEIVRRDQGKQGPQGGRGKAQTRLGRELSGFGRGPEEGVRRRRAVGQDPDPGPQLALVPLFLDLRSQDRPGQGQVSGAGHGRQSGPPGPGQGKPQSH